MNDAENSHEFCEEYATILGLPFFKANKWDRIKNRVVVPLDYFKSIIFFIETNPLITELALNS
jgi:hypothetical protein